MPSLPWMSVDEEGVGGSVVRGIMSFFAVVGLASKTVGAQLDTRKDVKEKEKDNQVQAILL